MNKLIDISVVVPVYNEENNLETFAEQTTMAMESLNVSYEILFILDPSTDNSLEKIKEQIKKNANIKLILLSRRFGQQAATMAGIYNCKGENCVIIDCDLQDPPKLIVDLYKKLKEGYDVVVAKRKKRSGETIIKKI